MLSNNQKQKARKWYDAELLSEKGYDRVTR